MHELFPELEKQGGSRFVDMLVKTFTLEGSEKYMLIHIEIQAQNGPDFSKRMFQYFYRIYDRYDVPITALAVFTGGKPVGGSEVFHYQYLDTSLDYKFKIYHILDHSEDQLLAMDNPFSLIVLAAQKALVADKIPQQELAEHRLTIAKALIESKRYDNEQIRRFLFFLKTFIYIDNSEINSNFDKQIASLTGNEIAMGIIETIKMITREEALEEGIEKGMQKGIQKGIEKGIEKGENRKNHEFVKNLLLNTDFSISKIAALAGVSEDFAKEVQSNVKK
jgi:predicted transposase/invertase (TIGR01784 family)